MTFAVSAIVALPPKESGGWIDTVFDACVDLLLNLAAKLGISYNAVNVWIFCIVWPLLTLTLVGIVIAQHRRIRRLRRSLRVAVSTKL